MRVSIISPLEQLYESHEVELVQLPGINGSFEILKNHAPMLSALTKGRIRIVEKENKEKYFEISAGIIEVLNNDVNIIVQ